VVCTATTSASPVFRDSHLKRGVHINAVGAYTPQMQEIPSDTVARARIVVDSRTASLVEAGDLVIPIQSGLISAAQIYAELGEIVLGQKAGRSAADQLTLFKSVGLAAQDAAAASLAIQNARAHGIGQEVVW
jgi:alanine dehydrogenase